MQYLMTPTPPILPILIESVRDLFEIPDGITYLNCASMAPQLRCVTEAGCPILRAGFGAKGGSDAPKTSSSHDPTRAWQSTVSRSHPFAKEAKGWGTQQKPRRWRV